jgi:hypothetical protein
MLFHGLVYWRAIPQAFGVQDKVLLGVLRQESLNGRLPIIGLVNECDLRKKKSTKEKGQ